MPPLKKSQPRSASTTPLVPDLKKTIKSHTERRKKPTNLWTGPNGEGPNGGVTQGLLAKFLSCRERFRLLVCEGLKPHDRFDKKREFGQMWHVCEEVLASPNHSLDALQCRLRLYREELFKKYPTDKDEINKWYKIVSRQFPLYVRHWSKHPDMVTRTPLLSEQVFDVPYRLPSGRSVRLRGKWDSVDLVDGAVVLMENKTKGDIDEERLKSQLESGFELQTQLYMVALAEYQKSKGQYRLGGEGIPRGAPIAGVRYNVVRRPLSGGRGTIIQGKGTQGSKCPKCNAVGRVILKGQTESSRCPKCDGQCRLGGKPPEADGEYYDRLLKYIEDEPEYFFMRWNVGVTSGDILKFREECLDPILETMSNWWSMVGKPEPITGQLQDYLLMGYHWRTPYNVWDPLSGGGMSEYDAHLRDGMEVGLERTSVLFPELQEST